MKCPFCGFDDSKVVDSRPTDEGTSIRRRRECLKCLKRFTTYETVERMPLMLVKRDGTRQAYDRQKLLNGLVPCSECTCAICAVLLVLLRHRSVVDPLMRTVRAACCAAGRCMIENGRKAETAFRFYFEARGNHFWNGTLSFVSAV